MEILDEVIGDILAGTLTTGDREAQDNTRSIALTAEQAKGTSPAEIESFLERARQAYASLAANNPLGGVLRFYAWVDEQAGQLRFSVSSLDPLPFGAPIQLVSDALAIANQFLASDYLQGIPWSEFEEVDDHEAFEEVPEPIRVPFDVYAVTLVDPAADQQTTTAI